MEDLGPLAYFFGLEVHKIQGGLFINQHNYTQNLIVQARLQNKTPVDTPLELNLNHVPSPKLKNQSPYFCLHGSHPPNAHLHAEFTLFIFHPMKETNSLLSP